MTYTPTTDTNPQFGQQGQSVADLQTKLNTFGAGLNVDSKYGVLTQSAFDKYKDQLNPPSTVTPPSAPTTIDTSKLSSSPVQVPQSSQNSPQSFVNSLQVGDVNSGIPSIDTLKANVSTAQSAEDQTTKEIKDLMTQLGYQSSDTADLQNKANITGLEKNITDLNTEFAQKKADYEQKYNQIGSQNIPSLFISGQEALAHSAASTELGSLAAQIQAANGNLNTAFATIDKTIQEKYQPIQDSIDAKLKFYEINKDQLSSAQKELADRQTEILQAQKDDLARQQKFQEDSISLIKDEINKGKLDTQTGMSAIANIINGKGNVGDILRSVGLNENVGTKFADTKQTSLSNDVTAILEGRNTMYNIRQTMGRTNAAAAYMQSVRDAISKIDPNFDFVASDAGGKSVSTGYVQRATAAINSVLPNIDKIVDLSNQVSRIGVKGVDNLLQKTAVQIGDQKVSNFREAQKLIADEIGVALGAGTVSDMKLQLGFDVTDPSVTPEVFASNMEVVKEFIDNRLKGLNSLRYISPTVNLTPDITALRDKWNY